jgi:hypothetical protein
MLAILTSFVATTVYAITGIIGPGMAFLLLLRKRITISENIAANFLRIITLGFLYNAYSFLAIASIARMDTAAQIFGVIVKISIDLVLLAWLVVARRTEAVAYLRACGRALGQGDNLVVLFICGLVGAYSLYRYPNVLDSAVVGWLQVYVDGMVSWLPEYVPGGGNAPALSGSSFGFAALAFFPGVLLRGIPVVTLAAGYKVVLCLLLGLTSSHLLKGIAPLARPVTRIGFLMLVLLSGIGQHGIVELGKDSAWAVVLSLVYIAELIRSDPREPRWYPWAAVYFTCAISAGSIVFPYMMLITIIYMILTIFDISLLRFSGSFLLVSCLSVGTIFSALKGTSTAATIGGALVGAGIALGMDRFLVRRRAARLQSRPFEPGVVSAVALDSGFQHRLKWLLSPAILALLSMAGCAALMPVRMAIPSLNGTLANVAYNDLYLWPLDGSASFFQFLFPANNPYTPDWYQSGAHGMSNLVVAVGIAGIFLMYLCKETAGNRGLQALGIFPFAGLFGGLVFAHLPWCPVARFNLWDLIKDIPQWYGGLVFSLFALIALSTSIAWLSRLLEGSTRLVVSMVLLVLGVISLVASDYQITRVRIDRRIAPAYFTDIGGYEDDVCADVVADVWKLRSRDPGTDHAVRNIFVVTGSHIARFYWHLPMYGLRQSYISTKDQGWPQTIRENVPMAIVGHPDEIRSIAEGIHEISFEEIKKFPRVGESLYLARKKPGPTGHY